MEDSASDSEPAIERVPTNLETNPANAALSIHSPFLFIYGIPQLASGEWKKGASFFGMGLFVLLAFGYSAFVFIRTFDISALTLGFLIIGGHLAYWCWNNLQVLSSLPRARGRSPLKVIMTLAMLVHPFLTYVLFIGAGFSLDWTIIWPRVPLWYVYLLLCYFGIWAIVVSKLYPTHDPNGPLSRRLNMLLPFFGILGMGNLVEKRWREAAMLIPIGPLAILFFLAFRGWIPFLSFMDASDLYSPWPAYILNFGIAGAIAGYSVIWAGTLKPLPPPAPEPANEHAVRMVPSVSRGPTPASPTEARRIPDRSTTSLWTHGMLAHLPDSVRNNTRWGLSVFATLGLGVFLISAHESINLPEPQTTSAAVFLIMALAVFVLVVVAIPVLDGIVFLRSWTGVLLAVCLLLAIPMASSVITNFSASYGPEEGLYYAFLFVFFFSSPGWIMAAALGFSAYPDIGSRIALASGVFMSATYAYTSGWVLANLSTQATLAEEAHQRRSTPGIGALVVLLAVLLILWGYSRRRVESSG